MFSILNFDETTLPDNTVPPFFSTRHTNNQIFKNIKKFKAIILKFQFNTKLL